MNRIHELMVRELGPGEYAELWHRTVSSAAHTAIWVTAKGFRASQLIAEPAVVLVERPR